MVLKGLREQDPGMQKEPDRSGPARMKISKEEGAPARVWDAS